MASYLSPVAQAYLMPEAGSMPYPSPDDKDGHGLRHAAAPGLWSIGYRMAPDHPYPAGLIASQPVARCWRSVRRGRSPGVAAEPHGTEAGPHTGFPGGPEGQEIDGELHRSVAAVPDED